MSFDTAITFLSACLSHVFTYIVNLKKLRILHGGVFIITAIAGQAIYYPLCCCPEKANIDHTKGTNKAQITGVYVIFEFCCQYIYTFKNDYNLLSNKYGLALTRSNGYRILQKVQ